MYKISGEVRKFAEESKKKKLDSEIDNKKKRIAEEKIQRGILQGDALSPLPFVIVMMPLNIILRKDSGRHKFYCIEIKDQPAMYLDDIKLIARNEKEQENQTQAVRIYNLDIAMDFVIENVVCYL